MNIRLQQCHSLIGKHAPTTISAAGCHSSRRPYAATVIRKALAMLMLMPALATAGEAVPLPLDDFYITVTANDIYLCGEGFGGIYGCIDEAISREATSVVISASTEASVHAVHDLIRAVHAIGFGKVGFATFEEADT